MSSDDQWTIAEAKVWHLYLNGAPIRNMDGKLASYASEAEAHYVAEHWDDHRAPTYAELRGMSDDELLKRAERLRP